MFELETNVNSKGKTILTKKIDITGVEYYKEKGSNIFKPKSYIIANIDRYINARLLNGKLIYKKPVYDYDFLMIGYMQYFNEGLEASKVDNQDYFSNTVSYLVSFMLQNHISTDWVENYMTDRLELSKRLSQYKYRVIGISTTFMYNYDEIREVIDFVKRHTNSKVVVGGSRIKYAFDNNNFKVLKEIGADYYINSSKGESALLGIVEYEKGYKLKDFSVSNVAYIDNDIVKYTKTELDNYKFGNCLVNWNLFRREIRSQVAVRTAVSCPFNCKFCSHKTDAGPYEYMSVDKVIKELDQIASMPQVKRVLFTDNTMNVPQDRFEELLDKMIEKRYPFTWEAYVRCQFITDKIAKKMKESGCVLVRIGVESGSDFMLNQMNKQTTIAELKKGIKSLQKYGINVFSTFLVGFPGETRETVEETISFLKETEIESYVQPWLNVGNAPINLEKDKWNIKGGIRDWSHKTMDFKTANQLSQYVMEQTKKTLARSKWEN